MEVIASVAAVAVINGRTYYPSFLGGNPIVS